MKILKIIITLMTILFMCTIFWFSSRTAEESTEQSNEIGFIVGRIVVADFNNLPVEKQYEYADSIDYYVRKSAHAAEYLFLGVLCALTLYFWFLECPYLVFLLGWLITVLYAESDEIHQYYVPGRACMFTDVLIDAGGALAGVLITAVIYLLLHRRKNKIQKMS